MEEKKALVISRGKTNSLELNHDQSEFALLLKEIGYSDWLELPFYHMRVGDKTLWWVYVTEDEDENLVYETIEKSDISDKITLCRTKEDFFETAKRLIKESGHDVDAIFSNKPIGNDCG